MNAALDAMFDEVPEAEGSEWDPEEPAKHTKRLAKKVHEGVGEPLVVRGVVIQVSGAAGKYGRLRPREVRSKTESLRDTGPAHRRHLRLVGKDGLLPRELPATRADCVDGPRPCPYVSCRHHLYLDATERDGVKLAFPDLEPDEIPYTCALDVAEAGGATLEQCGALMNVTRERIRQLEARAFKTMRKRLKLAGVGPGIDPEDRDEPW